MKNWIKVATIAGLLIGLSPMSNAIEKRTELTDQSLLHAEKGNLNFNNTSIPSNLVEELKKGGHVIVFRYTGAGGKSTPVDPKLKNIIDDGQRISERSKVMMQNYGKKYQELNIPINRVLSSEYFFVWQHALSAFGEPIQITRDLTGSLYFRNPQELNKSLQNLRDRIVTPPDAGQNTILFTHQGKFDKAYGYYIPAGNTIIFKPNGTSTPQLITVLSYEEFMTLKDE